MKRRDILAAISESDPMAPGQSAQALALREDFLAD